MLLVALQTRLLRLSDLETWYTSVLAGARLTSTTVQRPRFRQMNLRSAASNLIWPASLRGWGGGHTSTRRDLFVANLRVQLGVAMQRIAHRGELN